jgi:hypothetical protein
VACSSDAKYMMGVVTKLPVNVDAFAVISKVAAAVQNEPVAIHLEWAGDGATSVHR